MNTTYRLVIEETRFYPTTGSYSTTTCYGTPRSDRYAAGVDLHATWESAEKNNYTIEQMGNARLRITTEESTLLVYLEEMN